MKKIHTSIILAFVIYTILSLLVFNNCIFGETICGHGVDPYGSIWLVWWFNKAMTQLKTNPYFTNYIFYPVGTSLAYHSVTPFNSLFGIVLQQLFTLYVSFNILFLLSFIFAGIGAYMLSYYLTKNHIASFFAGIIYSFSPFHILLGPIINLGTIQWIPFYILYLFKTFHEKKKTNAIICAIFLFMTAISAWYYMIFSFIFLAIFLIYFSIYKREKVLNPEFVKKIMIIILIFTIFIVPFTFPILDLWQKTDILPSAETFMEEASIWSQDLMSFFIPPRENPILSGFFGNIYQNFYGRNPYHHLFVGYSVFFMLVFYFSFLIKDKLSKEDKINSSFWIVFLVVSLLITLGPIIRIFNKPLVDLSILWDPIKYLYPASFFLKTTYIFDVMLTLCVSVLFAYGIKYLFNLITRKEHRIAIIILLIMFMSCEYYTKSYVTFLKKPEFFVNIAKDEGNYTILEIPVLFNPPLGAQATQKSMYYQTIHGKKMIFGHTSLQTPRVWEFLHSYGFIDLALFGGEINASEIQTYGDELFNFVKDNNVRYLVFEKPYDVSSANEDFYSMFKKTLEMGNIAEDLVFVDSEILVFDLIRISEI